MLEQEIQTYQEHKKELLADSAGKYVVIKGQEVAGVYDTEGDALREAYQRYGNVPFLVKKIQDLEETLYFASNLITV